MQGGTWTPERRLAQSKRMQKLRTKYGSLWYKTQRSPTLDSKTRRQAVHLDVTEIGRAITTLERQLLILQQAQQILTTTEVA